MRQSVIIQLSGGFVPVYAKRLMDSLKDSGIDDVFFYAGNDRVHPPLGFPPRWSPPSMQDSTRMPDVFSANPVSDIRVSVQLGKSSQKQLIPEAEYTIHCSLFNDAEGPFFPELARAMLSDLGTIEVIVDANQKTTSGNFGLTGCFKIIPHSYAQSLELALEGTARLLCRMIATCLSGNTDLQAGFLQIKSTRDKPELQPDVVSALRKKVRSAGLRKRIQQAFTIDRWNIGIIDAPIHEVALSTNKKWDVRWLGEQRGHDFRADPFGVCVNGRTGVFFEQMHNNRGTIHFIDEELKQTAFLPGDVHHSYPYTFEADGVTYVVPESSEKKEVSIYPLEPSGTQPGKPLDLRLGIHAVDPSIVYHQNLWWLFCTDRSFKGADTRLHLYFSSALAGPWEPHPMNPLKTDIRSARPAGHLFLHQNILYRPSQDSSITYGGRIIINRVDEISPTHYRETPINNLGPENFAGPYRSGTHTLSAMGDKTCIDGKRRVFHPFAFQRFIT